MDGGNADVSSILTAPTTWTLSNGVSTQTNPVRTLAGSAGTQTSQYEGASMAYQFEPGDDILDTRGIEERCDEIRTATEDHDEHVSPETCDWDDCAKCSDDAQLYLDQVAELCSELGVSDIGEREHSSEPVLIHREYWVDYCQELASDIGAIDSDAEWPNNCIDWERAARELEVDYMSVEFGGHEYLTWAY